jgi:cyanophycin synthetase
MRVCDVRTLSGSNIYSHDPVLLMKIDLEDLYEKESREFPGFNDRLLETLPGLHEHHCGLGRRGGFVERLREGTYFAHIVEHVALELTDATGIPVNRGKTISSDIPGEYLVAVTYKSERGMRCLLQIAVELVEAILREQTYNLQPRLEEARQIVARYELGPSTRAVVDAAVRRGIPYTRVNENSLVRFGTGIHQRHVEATMTDRTSTIAVDLAADKHLTKQLLAKAAIPVPRGCVVTSRAEAVACLRQFGGRVVVKPLDGNQGRGVSLNLSTEEQVSEAFDVAHEISQNVIVEELIQGRDYRIVLVDGKLVAAAERIPPHVWGDGVHSIAQLIGRANEDPLRGDDHEKPLTKIKTDPVVFAILKKHGRTLDDVPAEREVVLLRESANLSTGGSAKDVTNHVHLSIRRLCERAASVIGLDVCGIDFVLPDITQPFGGQGGIVEINAAPGIRMHHHPTSGQPRDVGAAVIDMLYPPGAPYRIPVISITGTNGKTSVTRMIGHCISRTGQCVGMATTDGIWIGAEEIARGDMTGPAAVLETARGGIVRSGLGYDWSDVGVITNIQADHIGQDGIESIEHIARIKSLVAERVREGGTMVLNADDPVCRTIPDGRKVNRKSKRIFWFSLHADSPLIQEHLAAGGTAFVVHGGWIEERNGAAATRVVRTSSIPVTLSGAAEFQVQNVLAVIAACRAYGMQREQIAQALQEFEANEQNVGRMNIFDVQGRYVIIDYGHNPAAIKAICRMTEYWPDRRMLGIIGLPGDRADSLLEESAAALACGFHQITIREEVDLRGRKPGEVPQLIQRNIERNHPGKQVKIILDELEAIGDALASSEPGDIIVAFCERPIDVRTFLEARGGVSARSIERPERTTV